MPWAAMLHDLFEYVSSQMTFDSVMKAEINSQCPEEPQAVGNRALSC